MQFNLNNIKKLSQPIKPQELMDIMARCGLSQTGLADCLCLSRSAVCCWVKGTRRCAGANAVIIRMIDRANTKKRLKEKEQFASESSEVQSA
jgi:DNA-binding transcriptional regulator YiaG